MPRQYSVSELAELLKKADPSRFGKADDDAIVAPAVAANPELRTRVMAEKGTSAAGSPSRPEKRTVAPASMTSRLEEVDALQTVYPVDERRVANDAWSVLGNFYGLADQPFGVTPDPRYLYLSSSHCEALASLKLSVYSDRGFVALIAPPGMGKTTLLFEFLAKMGDKARTAFLFKTQCNSRELLRYLLAELGVASSTQDMVAMHEQLNQVLVHEAAIGRKVILVVDEAQNLSPEVLETVRLLSNFETPSAKLIQIVLSGQPQLAEKLSRPELLQLRQRICVWRKLESLNPDEVAAYIEHRLEVAGYSGGTIFDQGALDLIAKQSKGIPRNINSLCFGALSVGFALRQKTIGTSVMNEVIADLSLDRLLYREPFAKGAQKESEKVADISSVRWP